ncbi:MAG: C_GCAxxG_C_C family protein [Solobacterium sp.]|jgi:C_GCAxxG_C_C family probable redox protein|nr:C_GCAxxG_C_C family protein [Erysipelotrichaceae bacterium]MBQ1326329.1 C_GCAxxG_C_C family protein [Solobacterium sp.]MBQ1383689.1 C_GCAxxG_C_C family protein [Solobacterium sp.]MBQ1446583.1 C_GCAxxG_C_C family protein [Solobacterium sp.]MBQ2690409.1 C_GCAxxG_C_C family protein [Solobacterium sp.]
MAEKMTVERAKEVLAGQGFHCSQAVVMHACEVLGLDKDLLLKVSGGLGGGCFHGDICGCVSGAIMAIGAVYGYNQPYSAEQNAILVAKLTEFEKKFEAKHGSLICKDLLGGYSFAVPEEAKKIMTEGLTKNCPALVASACEILDEIILPKE